jgi:hypothetical protein
MPVRTRLTMTSAVGPSMALARPTTESNPLLMPHHRVPPPSATTPRDTAIILRESPIPAAAACRVDFGIGAKRFRRRLRGAGPAYCSDWPHFRSRWRVGGVGCKRVREGRRRTSSACTTVGCANSRPRRVGDHGCYLRISTCRSYRPRRAVVAPRPVGLNPDLDAQFR